MSRNSCLVRGRAAFSSIYGAFGVVLAATLAVGLVFSASVETGPAAPREKAAADDFLDTLLTSSVPGGLTLEAAIGQACLSAHCPVGSWNRSAASSATVSLAAPLARALERHYAVSVAKDGKEWWRVGDLPRGEPATASRADVYHDRVGGFLSVTAVLSPG